MAAKAVGVTPEEVKRGGMEVVRKKMEEVHFSENAVKKMAIDREYKVVTDKINNEVNRQVFCLFLLFIYYYYCFFNKTYFQNLFHW